MMLGVRRRHLADAAAICGALLWSVSSGAQTIAQDVEPLIAPAQKVDSGIALARQQIGQGDLLGAASTLERVIIQNPESVGPRLLYVALLCRLDDRQGAAVELSLMPKRSVPDSYWTEVTAACGAMQRPGSR